MQVEQAHIQRVLCRLQELQPTRQSVVQLDGRLRLCIKMQVYHFEICQYMQVKKLSMLHPRQLMLQFQVFFTPATGAVTGRVLVTAQEGDSNIVGDQLRFGPNANLYSCIIRTEILRIISFSHKFVMIVEI